jgi:hypothetical protein
VTFLDAPRPAVVKEVGARVAWLTDVDLPSRPPERRTPSGNCSTRKWPPIALGNIGEALKRLRSRAVHGKIVLRLR